MNRGRYDERIGLVASLQRGQINRAQRKACGKLRPLHRCVFAVGHDAPP